MTIVQLNRTSPNVSTTAMTDDSPAVSGLFTDLYELSMMQAYVEEGMDDQAVFSLTVRRLPATRDYLLACGIGTVLDYLESLHFSAQDLAYLASLRQFSPRFLGWLNRFRFSGNVYAVPEGTPVFANEPILEISAPIAEAQLIETLVLNQVHLQTVLASKAVRVVTAAQGRPVVDFGARRMHGIDAAVKGARAFHIAGVATTSNVLAGHLYRLPVSGTMAHSYVQAHDDEVAAFRAFARLYPETTLLVDTYDTLEGVRRVVELAKELGGEFKVGAVRLDSGDLASLAKGSRKLLDDAGLSAVRIFASGGLDEYAIAGLLASGAPIDGFGIGTRMGVSSDAPDLDIAYKLVEYAGTGRLKLSTGKRVLPGRKQVFRSETEDSTTGDVIGRAGEVLPGTPLLRPVMRGGRRLPEAQEGLEDMRRRAAHAVSRLPASVRAIEPADPPYAVAISDLLLEHERQVTRRVAQETT
jgi:nicotinate phosphoribosyltransferase